MSEDLLKSPNHQLRASTAIALGNMGNPRATRVLIAALSDRSYSVRLSAIQALGKVPFHNRIVEALLRMLRDEDWMVRSRSLRALGGRYYPICGGALRERIQISLLSLLKDEIWEVRFHAVRTIRDLGFYSALDMLGILIETDKSTKVRYEASKTFLDFLEAVQIDGEEHQRWAAKACKILKIVNPHDDNELIDNIELN